jgi:DNA-binding NarL/FixJ family response regulator
VILVDLPPLLRDTVRGLLAPSAEFDVVDEPDGDAALADIRASGGGVVITALDAPERGTVASALGWCSEVRVLAISSDGRSGTLFQLRPEERPVGELSPKVLRAALRGTPRANDGRRLR